MEIKREVVEEKKEEVTPQLLMGLVPCLNPAFLQSAWKLIKEKVEALAVASIGEYTLMDVWRSIYFGQSHLYMAYVEEGKVKSEDAQAFIVDRLNTNPEKDFVGYMIVRIDNNGFHIWQAHIEEKFAGTNIMAMGIEFLKKQAKEVGAEVLSFSSYRKGWERIAAKLDFQPTYTVYRTKL